MKSKKTEAKVKDLMLTAGFHNANPPLVWRFDLERNHSFALSLQGEEGDWELGVTSPRGDFTPIAHFAAREDATEALARVEKALSKRKGSALSLLGTIAAYVGFTASTVALVIVLGGLIYLGARFHAGETASAPTPAIPGLAIPPMPSTAHQPVQSGVPQSADDVLQPPNE